MMYFFRLALSGVGNLLKKQCSSYDKNKMMLMKTILPFIIIIHHLSLEGYKGVEYIGNFGDVAMYIFFAMSGYGLIISYLNNNTYLDGFLKKSLSKLFYPYFIALVMIIAYRFYIGVDQVEILFSKGPHRFVPVSWFIFVLSYFYVTFYVVFKYFNISNLKKVLLVSFFVLLYYVLSQYFCFESWLYNRCPAFCIGMIIALYDAKIRKYLVRWHILVIGILCIIIYPRFKVFTPIYMALAFFCSMYLLEYVKQNKLIKFISKISFEMYIIQYVPIYVLMNIICVKSTFIMLLATIILDILIAYIIHKMLFKLHNNRTKELVYKS